MSLYRHIGSFTYMQPVCSPDSLQNLAAMVTAKHASCEDMENHHQPLPDDLLKKVAGFAFPTDINVIKAIANLTSGDDATWQRGINYVNTQVVKKVRQVGFMVIGVVAKTKVSVTFEKQQIISTSCSCSSRIWCDHIIALITYRIKYSNVVPVHAPLSETLYSLDRNQLQIALQHAVYVDIVGVLTKVFVRIDKMRDAVSSEIDYVFGLPDPTFGTEPETNTVLGLTVQELVRSFSNDCRFVGYEFSDIFDEARIRNSLCYKRYFKRVVDLVLINQEEAAGQLLIGLVTEAANVALSNQGKIGVYFWNLIKTLERMCSYYILEFTGKARADLVILCQNLNKTLGIDSWHSSWAQVPPISQIFHFDSVNEPGILNASQKSMFYEPLCASIVPDAGPEFYELLKGKSSKASSQLYNEPLPLMFLRFESLRLWKNANETQEGLLALGIAILNKLSQATLKFSILYQKADREKPSKNFRKRKIRDTKMCDDYASYAEQKADSIGGGAAKDELVEMCDILANASDSETLNRSNFLSLLSVDQSKLQYDWDKLPTETLSFCISYMCNFLYRIPGFHNYLHQADKDILILTTLRALELSRFCTDAREPVSGKEHASLKSLEQNLFDDYKRYTEVIKIVKPHITTELERLYMEMLCQCNAEGVCFFDNVVPLSFISFLVKRQLTDRKLTHEEKSPGRKLALFTLCHYTSRNGERFPYTCWRHEYSDNCLDNFKEIANCLLSHIRMLPAGNSARNFYLIKLLKHYRTVRDRGAIIYLLNMLQHFRWPELPEDTLEALLKFLLNCIEHDKVFRPHSNLLCGNMEFLCRKLGLKFVIEVLEHWKELLEIYSDRQMKSLECRIHDVLSPNQSLSESQLLLLNNYVLGNFKHVDRLCVFLKLIDNNNEYMERVFEIIHNNRDIFTDKAVSVLAEKKTAIRNERYLRYAAKTIRYCGVVIMVAGLSWLVFYK